MSEIVNKDILGSNCFDLQLAWLLHLLSFVSLFALALLPGEGCVKFLIEEHRS